MLTAFQNANLPTSACQGPSPITTTQTLVANATDATLSWKAIEFPTNPVVGYAVQYRAIELESTWTDFSGNPVAQAPADDAITVVISPLVPNTLYEFRVRPVLEDDCVYVWDAVYPVNQTPVLTPLTDPATQNYMQGFDWAQTTGLDTATYGPFHSVGALEDGTSILPDASGIGWDGSGAQITVTAGVPITLNRGQSVHIPAPGGSVIQADKDVTATITARRLSDGFKFARYSTIRPWHLSREFTFGAFRETNQIFHIYSLPGTSPVIEVWRQGATEAGDTLVTTLNGVPGGIVRFTHSDGSAVYGFRASEPIAIMHVSSGENFISSSGSADQKPLNPPALRVVMASTRNAAIAARYDGTAPTANVSSVGAFGAVSVARDQGLVPPGLPNGGANYSGDAITFDGGNLPIVGGPGADSDGTAQTLGQDIDTLISKVTLPVDWTEGGWGFLKVASPYPFTLTETDPSGAIVATYSADGVGPYQYRIANPTGGNAFETSAPAQFVAQTNSTGTRDDDEVALW